MPPPSPAPAAFDATLMPHSSSLASLPLFPLRTVLFPGGLLPLKVFENRYVEMTKACLRDGRPFGVCLITRGDEVARGDGGIPEFAKIGTFARIADFDMPQLGILHIRTEGLARFEVRQHAVDATGLVIGQVTPLADEPRQPLPAHHARLASVLEQIAARVPAEFFPAPAHYDDASWVGYRLAEVLPLPLSIRQRMLEVSDASVRLAALRQFMERQGLV